MGVRTPDLPLAASFASLVVNEDLGGGNMRSARFPGQHRVLGASAVAVSHTGNTTETTLATIVVPANVMGANGILLVTSLWSFTNNANNKTLRARFDGIAGTQYLTAVLASLATYRDQRQIANRNNTGSQVGAPAALLGGFGTSTAALVTSAVDTTVSKNLVLTGQLANAADTVTLEAYLVELRRLA